TLCINHQLFRVARMKTAGITDVEKRRNLIYDLLIGVGIPVLQMIAQYVVSGNRYDIFEDYGPSFSMWRTPLAFVFFSAWPVAIGSISLFYCAMAIYAFHKRRRNHMQLISGANRGRYLRLMAISFIEILGTIPVGTYFIVSIAKMGVVPWKGWALMHSHYSKVVQVAGFIWKNDPVSSRNLELSRWSLVACAFIFFALFGFAGEAREHYYHLYKSLARRIGKSTSTPCGAPLACVVRLPSWSVLTVFIWAYVSQFFLQYYSISPLCEEKRWGHKPYHGPNGSKQGQLEHLRVTHRPIFDSVHFYGKHP
ncbi:pheromone A receptor-domain-containing protein, partial [Russula emetica]